MKRMKMFKSIATGIIVCAMAVGIGTATTKTQVSAAETQRKIMVSGQGTVKVMPDIAYLDIGVQTDDAEAKKAQSENTKQMDAVIEALKKAGVSESDIKTSNYYMYPQYDYSERSQTLIGYTIYNTITVTVRDIDKVGSLIGIASDAGANVINTVRFSLSNSLKYYEEALSLAMQNAKLKANALAKTIDASISSLPVEIIENYGNFMPVSYREAGALSAETMQNDYAGASITSNELEVSANITVTYEY